ncbi:hypothetical protein D0812_22210 [Vibrio owensii]|uniref:Uncharacterized protein n=1 Tax=Vibrio owensii TaxID=696485 RepID=A0AAP9GFJ5_9VIBR|nr:hypothetical protein [Vibrio owensii]AYO17106.1 hypothetical protein D0812_22210 [Vibrio owensii]QGH49251.1 hypothetical protein APZ19_19220 [Vibrio owensii]
MANFMRSFNDGVNIANNFMDSLESRERRQRIEERQKTLQDREDTQWSQQQADRKTSLANAAEDRKYLLKSREQADQLHDLNVKNTEQNMKFAENQDHRAQIQSDQQTDTYNYNKKINQRQQDSAIMQDQYNRSLATQDFSWFESDEANEIYGRNPSFDPKWITSNETANASGYLVNVLNGARNGQFPKWNDPQLVGSLNQLFPEIVKSTDLPQYTNDGKKITGREITGVIPMEGGKVAIQMSITDEDGKTYQAPLTQHRTSDENDNVAVVGLDQLTSRINLISQAQQDQIFKQTTDYLALSSGKGRDKGTKSDIQKEQYQAENKIVEDYRSQISEVDNNMQLDPAEKQQRILELEKRRDAELAQLRLRTNNTFGENDPNIEGKARENKMTQFIDNVKAAYPDYDITPQLEGILREAVERGATNEQIIKLIEKNAQRKSNGKGSGDGSSDVMSRIKGKGQSGGNTESESMFGEPTVTDTGAATTTGGRFYNVGNDLFKPNKVNEAQANMTPYQATPPPQSLSNYGY